MHGHLKRGFQFHIQISDDDNRLTSAVILYFSFIEASSLVSEVLLKRRCKRRGNGACNQKIAPENGASNGACNQRANCEMVPSMAPVMAPGLAPTMAPATSAQTARWRSGNGAWTSAWKRRDGARKRPPEWRQTSPPNQRPSSALIQSALQGKIKIFLLRVEAGLYFV